jgi:hypothetical protein
LKACWENTALNSKSIPSASGINTARRWLIESDFFGSGLKIGTVCAQGYAWLWRQAGFHYMRAGYAALSGIIHTIALKSNSGAGFLRSPKGKQNPWIVFYLLGDFLWDLLW